MADTKKTDGECIDIIAAVGCTVWNLFDLTVFNF